MFARLVPISLALIALSAARVSAQSEVDLLGAVPAQVVVSSALSPGLAGPSRMLDHRDDTAWCSRTGDLVGAWVLVALPADAHVSSIALTPGTVQNEHGVAEWERNQRITRVAVSRDGVLLGEFPLDPARASLQTIPVSGGGGLYRIEVRAAQAGSTRSAREACISALEVRGTPGREHGTAEARVGTLRGDGHGARVTTSAPPRTQRFAQAETYGGLAMGDIGDDERALASLVQGSHVSRVRVHLALTRGPARGDRVHYVYYYLSLHDEEAMTERMARRGRGRFRREGCDDHADECPSLRLARVSVPASGVPVVDGDVELGQDVCTDELHTIVRDLDEDGREELRATLAWQTHPVCPVGYAERGTEQILDEGTLRAEYAGTPRRRDGGTCAALHTERRQVADRDGDGHPDFEVHVTEGLECPDDLDDDATRAQIAAEGGRPHEIEVQRWHYDPPSDAWSREP